MSNQTPEATGMSEQIMGSKGFTLSQHVAHQQRLLRATGELSAIVDQIAVASKAIARAISQAGLFERGDFGSQKNVYGEHHRRMEAFANEAFIKVFSNSPWGSILVNDKMEEPLHLQDRSQGGKYILFYDALAGASNLEVNGVTGTIFSVYRKLESGNRVTPKDLLQKGAEQVAAGYIVYGPCTVFVYTAGHGVSAYTLDTTLGEFLITHDNIHIPERGLTYSCNEAHYHDWHASVKNYIDFLRKRDPKTERHYTSRFARSVVFNFHRTLVKGGVFMDPPETADPAKSSSGSLRLMFECNPLAFIAEQAGGKATTGTERILKLQPAQPNQQCTLTIGSPYEVLLFEDFVQGRR